MIMAPKDKRPSTFLSRMSNDSFISLFMVGVLIVIFGLACVIVPNFHTPKNIVNILTNNWYIIILGIGVTFLLITGNFDMSVGGVIALSGVLSVYFGQGVNVSPNELANGLGLPYVVAIIAAMACAMGIGAINAFFIARLKVPSIIVTLGTMMLARGIAQIVTHGAQRNTSLPDVFGVLGNTFDPGHLHQDGSVLIMVVLVLAAFVRENHRPRPPHVFLIGANREAARLSGIKVARQLDRALHPELAARAHHGHPAGLRVQGGVSSRATGYEFDALVMPSWGASASPARFRFGAGDVRRGHHPLRSDASATGLLLSPDWQFTTQGHRHLHRDPRAAFCPGQEERLRSHHESGSGIDRAVAHRALERHAGEHQEVLHLRRARPDRRWSSAS